LDSECQWLAEFLLLTSAHQIPATYLSNLLSSSRVKRPNGSTFPGAAAICPPWADFQLALLHHFTRSYTAAGAYCVLHCARSLPGTTEQEAVQWVASAELVLALSLKGVPLTARPNKQLACIYQNQLSEEEFSQWSAAANAHHEMSDAALAALESAAAEENSATMTFSLSCLSESLEHWFLGRAEHISNFLMDQAKALGGQGTLALEAVTTAEVGADSALGGATGGQGAPTPVTMVSNTECLLRVARAERVTSSVAPQE
jgi:hypothetical protein